MVGKYLRAHCDKERLTAGPALARLSRLVFLPPAVGSADDPTPRRPRLLRHWPAERFHSPRVLCQYYFSRVGV